MLFFTSVRWTLSDLSPLLRQRFFTQNGAPLNGGKLWSYQAGTTTPLQTFTDDGGLTPCTNPIILDANGETSFYIGDTAYKFVLLDSSDVPQWTVDNVLSLRAQIAAAVNTAGALAIANNLSDLANKSTALINLGIAPFLSPKSFPITNNQAAANLAGETFDGAVLRAVIYEYIITQSTTVGAWGRFIFIYINGTWTRFGDQGEGTAHGIAFTSSQATTVGQLLAAETGGLGNGTLLLQKRLVLA